jgi:DNA-binding IclR family transcriptional regulator
MQSAQVKSATRALEILEYFRTIRQPRAMSEIALALRYPQSSTTVLLKTLVTLGYLNFDRRARVYFPTPKVTSLGEWVPRALFGSSRIHEAMRDVHAATAEGVGLGTKNDVYLQYLQNMDSTHPLRFVIPEGTLRPLTQSGIGWTLMSTLTDDQVDNFVRRANIASEKGKRVTVESMLEKVREIREKGYCFSQDVPFAGGATLSMLLPVQIQNQPAVLFLGGAKERFIENHSRYLAVLQRAVKSIGPQVPFEEPIDIEF